MLTFLRKHQRVLFIVISVITIASFSFFGTFGAVAAPERAPAREIGRALDGSVVMDHEVEAIVAFLGLETGAFFRSEFLATGLGTILAERYFSEIEPEFAERLQKIKQFRPYVHPQTHFISAETVWKRFTPQLLEHLQAVRQAAPTASAFSLYCQLYLDEQAFPPQLLQKVLQYQVRQNDWVQQDPGCVPERLALSGARSLEDWFGPKYMEQVALFLINTAKIAEKKGYKISAEEVRADLLRQTLTTLQIQRKETSLAEAGQFLRHELRSIGLDDARGDKIWKKVMLFRRLFNDVGQAVLVDPLSYSRFATYAGESADVELYTVPPLLRLTDLSSLLRFQFYLDAISPKSRSSRGLLSAFYSASEVEKRVPELVESRFVLDVAKVTKEELADKVSLKESWAWEMSDAGWSELLTEFPILSKSKGDRFIALEELDAALRLKVDRFARGKIVENHPEWIVEELEKKSAERMEVGVRSRGTVYPFTDVEDAPSLLFFLQRRPKEEHFCTRNAVYKVTVIEQKTDRQVMTFEESLRGDLIGQLLDKKLEEAYLEIRKKEPAPFTLEKGGFAAFQDVREEVGARLYGDVLKMISAEEKPFNYYASHRLYSFVNEARRSVVREGDSSSFVKPTGDRLRDQFLLVKEKRAVRRSDALGLPKEELFSALPGSWSHTYTSPSGDVGFFRVENRGKSIDSIAEAVDEGQKMLGMDAKRVLMHQVLNVIAEKR